MGAKKTGRELSPAEKSEFDPKKLRVKRASELLDMVAPPRSVMHRHPNELLGDRRQRVAVARVLVLSPEVIVPGEAVSTLDALVQDQILYLLNDLQAQLDLPYPLIVHGPAVVRQIADDIVAVGRGRFVKKSTTDALFTSSIQDCTREPIGVVPGHKIQFGL